MEAVGGWHVEEESVAREIDEPSFHVGLEQLDADTVAHIETLEAALQPAFHRRMEEPDPRSLFGSAGDERVERVSDSAGQEQRGGGLPNPPLNFRRVVLPLRAVLGEFR